MTAGRRLLLLLLALLLGLAGTLAALFLCPVDLADRGPELQVHSALPVRGEVGEELTVTVSGRGLDGETVAWLFPETTRRQAVVSALRTWGELQDLTVEGTLAYLANGRRGLLIVDLGDPLRPEVLGAVELPGMALQVSVRNRYALVACGSAGLQVVDVGDPRQPRLVAGLDTVGTAWKTILDGDLAYLAAGRGGVLVLDVADPRRPRPLASLPLPGHAMGLARCGKHSVVALGQSGFAVVDLSRPERPLLVGPPVTGTTVWDVAASGSTVFLSTRRPERDGEAGGGLTVVDLSAGGRPRPLSFLPLSGRPWKISVDGDRLFVTLAEDGFRVVDAADPRHPRVSAAFDTLQNCRAVVARGHLSLVANGRDGLQVVDLDRLEAVRPFEVFSWLSPPWTLMERGGELLLLAGRPQGGAQILAADALAPDRRLATLPLAGDLIAVAAGESLAAFSVRPQGAKNLSEVSIVDFSAPAPRIRSTLRFDRRVSELAFSGRMLLLGDGGFYEFPDQPADGWHLRLFDLSDPDHPRESGSFPFPGLPKGLAAQDGLALVGSGKWQSGETVLHIVSLEPSEMGRTIGEYSLPFPEQPFFDLQQVTLRGKVAFLAAGRVGLLALDLSDPRNPRLLDAVDPGGCVKTVALAGNLAFVGVENRELVVIDVGDSRRLLPVGSYPLPYGLQSLLPLSGRLLAGSPAASRSVKAFAPPLPLQRLAGGDDGRLQLRIPSPDRPGTYTLWLSRAGSRQELPGLVTFTPPEPAGQ